MVWSHGVTYIIGPDQRLTFEPPPWPLARRVAWRVIVTLIMLAAGAGIAVRMGWLFWYRGAEEALALVLGAAMWAHERRSIRRAGRGMRAELYMLAPGRLVRTVADVGGTQSWSLDAGGFADADVVPGPDRAGGIRVAGVWRDPDGMPSEATIVLHRIPEPERVARRIGECLGPAELPAIEQAP